MADPKYLSRGWARTREGSFVTISRWEISPDGKGARCPSRGCNFIAVMREGRTIVGDAADHTTCGDVAREERVTKFDRDGVLLRLTHPDSTPCLGNGGKKDLGEIKCQTVREGVRLYLKEHPMREMKAAQTDQGISNHRKRKRKVYSCSTVARFLF